MLNLSASRSRVTLIMSLKLGGCVPGQKVIVLAHAVRLDTDLSKALFYFVPLFSVMIVDFGIQSCGLGDSRPSVGIFH